MTASASSEVVAEVVAAGLATVQDLGRPGRARVGVSANGAGDRYAARAANILVNNAEAMPHVEIVAAAFALTARRPLLVAVTGAARSVEIGGLVLAAWEPHLLWPGDTITVAVPSVGMRSYLAIHGGISWPRLLGSVAPDALLGFGHRLRAGDTLRNPAGFEGMRHPHFDVPVMRLAPQRQTLATPVVVHATAGPEASQFEDGLERLLTGPFRVSPQSDHIGLRLAGPAPRRRARREMLSRGVPVGAVEVPPAGDLLVLMRARYVTAGYPVVAVVTSASVDALAQARPGDAVAFRLCSDGAAVERLRRQEAEIEGLRTRARRLFAALGVPLADVDAHRPPPYTA